MQVATLRDNGLRREQSTQVHRVAKHVSRCHHYDAINQTFLHVAEVELMSRSVPEATRSLFDSWWKSSANGLQRVPLLKAIEAATAGQNWQTHFADARCGHSDVTNCI